MPQWTVDHKIKAAFFDADGTLLSFSTHKVPESALLALSGLKRAGIKCFLATGRAPYTVEEIPLDSLEAFILFNGQFILNRDRILYQETLDKDDLATIVKQVEDGLYNCMFMSDTRMFVSGHDPLVEAIEHKVGLYYPEDDIHEALSENIYQLNIFLEPGKTDVVRNACSHIKMTRWTSEFVDVFPKDGGKDRAVRKVLDMYGIAPEEAVAFGDGGNDLGMFGVCGTTVAMGNANDEVKEQADFVTDDVDHDGILNACVRLGLLAQ